jgi:hypothetical protein
MARRRALIGCAWTGDLDGRLIARDKRHRMRVVQTTAAHEMDEQREGSEY